MNTERVCPSCKKQLPEGAPKGLCPECLMKAGFPSTVGQPGGNPKFVPPAAAELAKLFPQLEILELIGQGGMGAVYKARQPGLDRLVAVKILPPDSTASAGFAERFAREARALARLNHPNIVGIYDFGKAGDLHFFVMEFVDGLNLRELKRGGKLSAGQALQIVPQMCDALQFAHEEGIVHRDIKPENVMVDKKGRVKITDFGLAKLLGKEPENLQLTGAADVMGTPHYMAPEQLDKPQQVDHRADIYSLGVVFYELLTGELPIGKFAPPSKKVEVDVRLDEVVLHTLEREPERRYQHASEVKSDVETITHTPRVGAPPPVTVNLEASRVEDARRQVKGPAIGLVVTALLNWVGIPFTMLFAAYLASAQNPSRAVLVLLPLTALVLSSVMLVAGFKMKRLQAYWLAVTGSILAMLVTPGNIVGLPVGIWCLVVLSQRHVRESFGKNAALFPWQTVQPASPGSGAWKIAAVIVAAVMLITAIPVGAIVLSMLLPALSKAKARAQLINSYLPLQEVTLNGLESGRGQEALDLDGGQVLNLPGELRERRGNEDIAWLENNGVDVVVERVRGRWGLITASGNELKLTPVTHSTWLNVTVPPTVPLQEEVFEDILRRGNMVVYVLRTNAQPPLPFSYQTASGGKGLLQVTAFGEDPDYAKVQIKRQRATGRSDRLPETTPNRLAP